MLRDHAQCLFVSAPISDCGRDMRLPEPVLASHWPLAFIGLLILALALRTFVQALYPHEIDWEQEPEKKPLRHPEDAARDAGA